MAKLQNQFTINTDKDTALLIEKLAKHYQRKPAELLRLLLVPTLCDAWAQVQVLNQSQQVNNFTPSRAKL